VSLDKHTFVLSLTLSSDPAGIRTQDPIIKSDVLYQLSYGIIVAFKRLFCLIASAKVTRNV
jgi:hypothetical protein